MTHLINGKKIANTILHDIRSIIIDRTITPGLAIILVENDPASEVYVKRKLHTAYKVGITPHLYRFTETDSENSILECIDFLNADPDIHGIIVQLPLPNHLNPGTLIQRIRPDKDADGFHPENIKHLGDPTFPQPVTAMSVMECLNDISTYRHIEISNAAIICKSDILFSPLAKLLARKNITTQHFTDVNKNCAQYDIIIIALGKPHILTKEYTKKDAIIIDVGISRIKDNGKTKILGDADSESLKNHVSALTPVPGGVGPVTVALLLKNTTDNCIRTTKSSQLFS